MRVNKVTFYDIVKLLKEDINLNVYEICFKLGCGEGTLYRRMIHEKYRGLSQLKDAIRKGEL